MKVERFWRKVARGEPDGCWLWVAASKNRGGYGLAWFDLGDGARLHGAHRVAFAIDRERKPGAGLDIMHSCDVRACCNPRHLSEGTRLDNMRDCSAKGRTRRTATLWGEGHNRGKLTEKAVHDVRARLARGERNVDVARLYGVRPDSIRRIKAGETWRHLPVSP